MKDSAVDPPGLFDPRRQKRLLSGLAQRCKMSADQQRELMQRHNTEKDHEEQTLASSRNQQTDECRRQRREMLQQWDAAEEKLTATYEARAIKTRKEINRLSAIFRKQLADGKKNIDRKVDARREAVVHQYETRKNQPIEQRQKEIEQIDSSLLPMQEDIDWARDLTVRRLDGLPPVGPAETPEENMAEVPPTSVQETVDTVYRLTRKLKATVLEMQTGAASKTVDSFYLPAGVAVFIVVWIIGVLLMKLDPPWIPMIIGIVTGGVLGFVIYAILLLPLKRMTRALYPRVERIVAAAEEAASTGRQIAEATEKQQAKELIDRRDSHLAAADRWKTEQYTELELQLKTQEKESRERLTTDLNNVDEQYLSDYSQISTQMHNRAESLAIEITDALSQTDKQLQEQRLASQQYRETQLQRLAHRLKQGVHRGMQRIEQTNTTLQHRFPNWESVANQDASTQEKLDCLPVGNLSVGENLRQSLSPASQAGPDGVLITDSATPAIVPEDEIPSTLPVVIHRRLHSGMIIHASPTQMENAIDIAHQILWRLLTGVMASRAKLTLLDPLGRGQHFTSFMALTDHDPSLVGHRVWASESNIEQRLGEIALHVEDVLQSSLRDRFERIEDYNEVAGSMAEPYRIVAGVGLPEGLTRNGYKHLLAIIQSGVRCGVFTVIVADSSKPWPADMPMPSSDKLLQLNVDDQGDWKLALDSLDDLSFQPYASPPSALRDQLVKKIGTAAVAASRVEIPLSSLLNREEAGEGSTDDGIDIVVGSQGANRTLSLDLGEGVRQHVLIAGKTGSGKSTLLHSIITSGAYRYRPDQLHYYLLDFKKGVEFKPYADNGLPHARVIGIESEREFGRSVLQRLDEELQERGEKFRSYGVQELSEYRGVRGDELPRIMLVVDEFQELFVRDDRLAGDCAMLLDRLVRQGRSFGMHVVLSSQSLAGAFSLPRATLGQMAVRIAMQCSESDAALILSDDNTAARLISRPGEAIYNDAGGLVEGNQPFQVAWLSSDEHKQLLGRIAERDDKFIADYAPPVIFEGNRPCAWSGPLATAAIKGTSKTTALRGFLGEAVEIGPPATLELTRNAGRNVLLITPAESRGALIASTVSSYAKSHPKLQVLYFDGTRTDDAPSLMPWLKETGINAKQIKPRDAEAEMVALSQLIKDRGDDSDEAPPIVAIIDPLDRFREFRQDESFNFSLDAAASDQNGASALKDVLRDGPAANVFVYLVCGGAETLSRWLPRASQHDLELRLLGRMNASDSSILIDSPIASELSAATMLLYDDSDGQVMKFRQSDLPEAESVRRWLAN